MSDKARQAFDAWKEADAQARGAETRLARAWEVYFATRSSEPPPRELIREVAWLRVLANGKLSAAMEALGARPGDSTHPGTSTSKVSERPSA